MKTKRGIVIPLVLAGLLTGCMSSSDLISGFPDLPSLDLFREEPESAPPSSIPVTNGAAEFALSGLSLAVVVDPSGSTGTDGVIVTAVRSGSGILVETADPLERYLPTVQVIPVEAQTDGPLHLDTTVPQVPREYRWNMMPLGMVSTRPLKSQRLGTASAGDLHLFLQENTASKTLNLLLPAAGLGNADEQISIYQTPASLTLLLLPETNIDDSSIDSTTAALTALSVLREDLPQLTETLLTLNPPPWPDSMAIPVTGASPGSGYPNSMDPAPEADPDETSLPSEVNNSNDWMAELPGEWSSSSSGWQIQIPEAWNEQFSPPNEEGDPPAAAAPGNDNPADIPDDTDETSSSPIESGASTAVNTEPTLSAGQSSTLTCQDGLLMVNAEGPGTITLTCSPLSDASSAALTFQAVAPAILGTCPVDVHDRFSATGPDGRTYRTWHPVTVPVDPTDPDSPLCTFAHEHGDPPHPDAPPPLFGYAAFHAGLASQITDHSGYKVFTHKLEGQTGWNTPEVQHVRPDWDMMVWVHMGSSEGRISTRWHEVGFWSRDLENRITEIHVLADTGEAANGCDQQPAPARRIASTCDFAKEIWDYWIDAGIWSATFQAEIDNPMTYLAGPVQTGASSLQGTSVNICGTGPEPCSTRMPSGAPGSYWLGNMRNLKWADWRWQNYGGEEFICTDPFGIQINDDLCSLGEYGALRQRVAVLTWIGEPGQAWDRTFRSPDTDLPLGAPGGN